jgi:FkbM family methyltransferase
MNLKDKFIYWYARTFGHARFFKWNFLLMRLGLSGMGVLNYQDFKISGEQQFKSFVSKNYSLGTIFDVGSNEGNYIQSFLESDAQIYCFEPHPETSQRLKKRYQSYPNIKVNPIGLSNQKTETFIYDYVDIGGSSHASLFKENISEVHNKPTAKTPIALDTLDNYLHEHDIESIDLLKIDTEGNEIFVLQGAKNALNDGRIKIIQMEFSQLNIPSGAFFKDFMKILSNYNIYRLLPNGFLPLDYSKHAMIYEQFAFQNIVAFQKNIDQLRTSI